MGPSFDISQTVSDNKDVTTTGSGTSTKRKNITKEGFDKIVYDILSSDSGLASIVSGENAAGGHSGTTKALLAQDMVVKLAGELANLTAEEVTSTGSYQKADSTTPVNEFFGEPQSLGDATVICTALYQIGMLSGYHYNHTRAVAHLNLLHGRTLAGYQSWAKPIANKIYLAPGLGKLFLPTCKARYEAIIYHRTHWTIWLGEPVCYAIGWILEKLNHVRREFA